MVVQTTAAARVRWGELEDADDYDFLPLPLLIGPDENGVKKLIEHKFNDDGEKVKITITTPVWKLARSRLSKKVTERRSWANADPGTRHTVVSMEEILLERPWAPGAKAEEPKAPGDKGGAILMVCRTCGEKGDHWTSRCPFTDLTAQPEVFIDKPSSDTVGATAGSGKGAYVPPRMRAYVDRSVPDRRRNDENSVRVTSLSEDTREPDLLELFRRFGPVTRVYVALDKKKWVSQGFGFVNFVSREDAERDINKLNGYGYDSLILRVE